MITPYPQLTSAHAPPRLATRADIPAIWEVRYSVTENTLTSGRISDEDVRREIEDTGQGWVIEVNGTIKGFAIGNGVNGNVWALFVHPDAQGLGLGTCLHDCLLEWFRTQPPRRLWLTTGADTRARHFYASRGWEETGLEGDHQDEVRFERDNLPDAVATLP